MSVPRSMGGKRTRRPFKYTGWCIPFEGEPPATAPGTPVEVRDGYGNWHPMIALAAPRYDTAMAIGDCWLSVPVVSLEALAERGAEAASVNWPAEDVRVPEVTP